MRLLSSPPPFNLPEGYITFMTTSSADRSIVVPQILPTPALKAELATLKAILQGYDLSVADESLLMAYPPETDELSSAQMAQVAQQFGVNLQPVSLSVDDLLSSEVDLCPFIIRFPDPADEPDGWLIVWRHFGPLWQLLDSRQGRRWVWRSSLLQELTDQATFLSMTTWREVAVSQPFSQARQDRLRQLGLTLAQIDNLEAAASAETSWRGWATLEAVSRFVARLVDRQALPAGAEAEAAIVELSRLALAEPPGGCQTIPADFWPVQPLPESTDHLWFRGISGWQVLSCRATQHTRPATPSRQRPPRKRLVDALQTEATQPPPAAPTEPTVSKPNLLHLLREDGLLVPVIVGLALLLAASGVVLQALLFRSFMELGHLLEIFDARTTAVSLLFGFVAWLLMLEWLTDNVLAGIGRRLDGRLRMLILERLPHLNPRYFHNLPAADLLERIHIVRDLHNLPQLGGKIIRLTFQLILTVIGIALIDPASAPLAVLQVALSVTILGLGSRFLELPNLQQRDYLGKLSRFYLDGMLGLVAVQVHGAERLVRRKYESLLVSWARTKLALSQAEFGVVAVAQLVSYGMMALIVLLYALRGGEIINLPLLLFWVLQLGLLSWDLVFTTLRYISEQSKKVRFFDLLAPSAAEETAASPETTPEPAGPTITLAGVRLDLDDQPVLRKLDLTIPAGSQVAIVGASGAGKSTLLSLLLGWHEPTTGQILIDQQPLNQTRLTQLRQQTAWLDPSVQLWNRSLLRNLQYGTGSSVSVDTLIRQANLREVLERLPKGLQTSLGEKGRLISAGQGQRVRFGRALQRPTARLVILDEPFRGLDREERYNLLKLARSVWPTATLICATHDVSHTLGFDRVLVMEHGRLVEDGLPSSLVGQETSRYRALLEAEEANQQGLWAGQNGSWRELELRSGRLVEMTPPQSKPQSKPPTSAEKVTINEATDGVSEENDDPATDTMPYSWPASRLAEAVLMLAQHSGLLPEDKLAAMPHLETPSRSSLGQRIEAVTQRLGLEAEPVKLPYAELEQLIYHGGPLVLALSDHRFVLLVRANHWRATIITPDLAVQRVKTKLITAALRHHLEKPFFADLEQFLEQLQLPPEGRPAARQALLAERLKTVEIDRAWLLRLSPGHQSVTQIRYEGLPWYLALAAGSEAFNGLLYLAIFLLFGLAFSQTQFQWAWLMAGLLMLVSRVPVELIRFVGEIRFSVGLETLLKQRLFYGVLRLPPDKIQAWGSGQFLGWLVETERFAYVARAGSLMAGYLASLGLTVLFLMMGAGGVWHGLLLVLWLILTGLVSWQAYKVYLGQHQYYLEMTKDLLERMTGHATRLVQADRARWHDEEDQLLTRYLNLSRLDDRHRTRLLVFVPYGWVVVGLLGIVTTFLNEPQNGLLLGISFLGIIWAFQQLQFLVPNILDFIRAMAAWQLLAPIDQAAKLPFETVDGQPPEVDPPLDLTTPRRGQVILESQALHFQYPQQNQPLLKECELRIHYGDRLWLAGPTGVGKSTLASLMVGLREPQAGLLMLYGLDHHTLSPESWRRHIALVPQFADNHVLNETLAFNLLLGRRWPPSPQDLMEAETICRELGLGDLLARMPRGLHEPIGETGWQLSQGERSRLYIARALLQQARLIILDESLASLDPENLQRVLHCVRHRAPTVLVIAQP